MNKILSTITELPVAKIEFGERLRPVSRSGVDALKASIEELGVMKDPIHVRKIKRSGEIVLMAGGHRLTAAIELGWEVIKVTCWECTNGFAELMEVDDNLAGAELTPLDTAVFLAARKDIYEKLHPETKAAKGADLVAKRWKNTADTKSTVSFAAATAEKFGISDRQVRRLVSAGAALHSSEVSNLRQAPKQVSLKDLNEIAKIGLDEERSRVVDLLSQGKAKNATEARRIYMSERGRGLSPLNATDQAYLRLEDAWKRAPKIARDRFLQECGREVQRLLDGLEGNQN